MDSSSEVVRGLALTQYRSNGLARLCTNELLVSAYITRVLPLYRISVHTERVMLQVSSVEFFLW